MTIERSSRDEILFVCDECGDVEQTGATNFSEALAEVKQVGWMAVKDKDGWQHLCKDCR